MRISDWSSDVCSSDLGAIKRNAGPARPRGIVDLAGGDDVELGQPAGIGFGRVELRPVGRQADAIGVVARKDHFLDEAAVGLGIEDADNVMAALFIIDLAMVGEPEDRKSTRLNSSH